MSGINPYKTWFLLKDGDIGVYFNDNFYCL